VKVSTALRRAVLRLALRQPAPLRHLANAARGIQGPVLMTRPPATKVAVLAPHPDDEILGCGGTIPKHLAAHEPVTVIFMTDGERTVGLVGTGKAAKRRQRRSEAVAAAAVVGLGKADLHFLDLDEGRISAAAGAALIEALQATGADLVYAPFPGDAHRDHAATTRLLASCLPELPAVRLIALYEVWTPLSPNCVVDITDTMEKKLTALRQYHSALALVDYQHTARGLAAYRTGAGLQGDGFAEAFCVLDRDQFQGLIMRAGHD
jgi:LmbE family N-acetylglucosaminyl deacetylase